MPDPRAMQSNADEGELRTFAGQALYEPLDEVVRQEGRVARCGHDHGRRCACHAGTSAPSIAARKSLSSQRAPCRASA